MTLERLFDFHSQTPEYDPGLQAWIVRRYGDVAAVLEDARFVPTLPDSVTRDPHPENEHAVRDRHNALSRAWNNLAVVLQQRVPVLVEAALHRLEPRARIDLVQDVLKPWALETASCAVDAERAPPMQAFADRIFAAAAFPYDPSLTLDGTAASVELSQYMPCQNPIALQAFIALSTSVPYFVGNAWAVLLQHPDELVRLQTAPDLLACAIEECLRMSGPPRLQFRRAACDADISGIGIRQNDCLALVIDCANRDPDFFADPGKFDIGRAPNRHLTFGKGGHSCIAAAMVRFMSAEITRRFLPTLATARVIEAPEWDGFAMRTVKRLRVALS